MATHLDVSIEDQFSHGSEPEQDLSLQQTSEWDTFDGICVCFARSYAGSDNWMEDQPQLSLQPTDQQILHNYVTGGGVVSQFRTKSQRDSKLKRKQAKNYIHVTIHA